MAAGNTTRRTFLKSTGLLSIGFSLVGVYHLDAFATSSPSKPLLTPPDPGLINAWIQILESGKIKILTGKIELGQGILTAIMQVAAEELNSRLELIDIHMADTNATPDEGYTAGSMSIESSAMTVRAAAARAREVLLEMAAKKTNLATSELRLENGEVTGGGIRLSLTELLEGKQLMENFKGSPTILGKTSRKYVGQPIHRRDIEEMARGNAHFVHDLHFPGMLHARIVRPPAYSAQLNSIDEAAILRLPALKKLVRIGSFIGVIAEEEFEAIQLSAFAASLVKWDIQDALPVNVSLKEYIKTLPADQSTEKQSSGWKDSLVTNPAKAHSATYYKPYIMHAANGPSCAVAIFKDGKLDVWSHTQGVYPLRKAIAGLLNLPEASVQVKGVQGPGCYGHNGADDVAAEASLLAYAYPGRPIRLQWMRQEENAWEPYSTAMRMELAAGIENGKITGWKYSLWSDVHGTRPGGNAANLLPARYINKGYDKIPAGFKGGAVRNAEPYYAIDQQQIQSNIFTGPLRRSSIRGLGAYANIFAIESFMDELAFKAGVDPVQFRIAHSTDPRSIACLEKLQQITKPVPVHSGQGMGYAFSRYKNSAAYCAVAVLAQVNENNGELAVKQVWGVVDAGETINSDGLKNQIEGGIVQSISWAMEETVQFDAKHITSLNWASYPILRFNKTPQVEVEIIDRIEEPPLGAGEAAQGPATAALANAIFSAVGIRVRDLPIKLHSLKKTT